MRVLVTESQRGGSQAVRVELTKHGHTVVACHTGASDAFHCVGTTKDGCPLDLGNVDVVVDVRGSDPEFVPREYGVVCARRASVPLVVVGPQLPVSGGHDLDTVAVQVDEDHVVDAVETAVALPGTAALHAVRLAVRDVLARHTDNSGCLVSFEDRGFYVDVVVRLAVVPDQGVRSGVESVVRRALRPFRSDWPYARVVFRRSALV